MDRRPGRRRPACDHAPLNSRLRGDLGKPALDVRKAGNVEIELGRRAQPRKRRNVGDRIPRRREMRRFRQAAVQDAVETQRLLPVAVDRFRIARLRCMQEPPQLAEHRPDPADLKCSHCWTAAPHCSRYFPDCASGPPCMPCPVPDGQPPASALYSATVDAALRIRPSAAASCACSSVRCASSTS